MADELDRSEEQGEPPAPGSEAHLPSPTIWPFAFAAGIALVLVGLIVNWIVAAIGVGALIGSIVTLPVAGFAIIPACVDQGHEDIDLGPLANFPEGQWQVATFYSTGADVSTGRRTAFIRNNGMVQDVPSLTIISNRCAHLGCPVQPQGPTSEGKKAVDAKSGEVDLVSAQPSGFGCPCHGGAYDTEGNRTAGPPVRALDRYHYEIVDGNLVLTEPYSVSEVDGTGAEAVIHAYPLADPGQHVDGPEQIFYPYIPK